MALGIKAKVDTIAILMLENRSFDHMFSFLSLDPANPRRDINGITSLRKRDYPNTSKTKATTPGSQTTIHWQPTFPTDATSSTPS